MSAVCSRCGAKLPDDAQFCMNCGRDVTRPSGRVSVDRSETIKQAATATQTTLIDTLRQTTLGEYEILSEIGRGGMANVYLAHDIALDRKVAIKVMSPALMLSDPGIAERFKREARTAAGLSHPHIIPVFSVKESEQLVYFVMKFVVGRGLESVIKEVGTIPVPMVQTILNQVGGALSYAHRKGVIHRDIKPGNIMLDEDGWAIVTDFGIAKVAEAEALTMTGGTVGTPAYMSPEQCQGLDVSAAADQYSLGVVAYEMLTGKQPFRGSSAMTVMYEHCHSTPPPIRDERPDCSEELATTIERMLEKQPESRWRTLDHAVAAIGTASETEHAAVRTQMLTLAQSGPAHALLEKFHTPPSPRPPSKVIPQAATPATPAPAASEPPKPGRKLVWTIPAGIAAAVVLWFLVGPQGPTGPAETSPALDMAQAPPPTETAGLPIAALEVAPFPRALPIGQTVQALATPVDAAGNPIASAEVIWESGNPAVATVSPGGLLTTLAPGEVQLTARSGTESATISITVTGPREPPTAPTPIRVVMVTVEPPSSTVTVGGTLQLRAIARDQQGNPLLGRAIGWTSSNPRVATVSSAGLVAALGEGAVEIVATSEGRSTAARLTVTAIPVASISVSPDRGSVTVGSTLQLRATPRDAQGAAMAGRGVTWTSSNPAVVRVSDAGLVAGVAPGSARVTAASDGISRSAQITVEAPPAAAVPTPDPRPEIERIINGYGRAIASRDLAELRRAYPGMTAAQERSWREFFQGVTQLTVSLTILELNIGNGTARARVDATYNYRAARREQTTFTFTAVLERGPSGWQLTAVQ